LAPYEPFCEGNNLAVIMQKALAQAGMGNKKGLRGLRLFRQSLATRLLREKKSMKVIGDVLGHQDICSTFIYTKVDVAELKTVAISIKEVLS
jgi:site-specific recombinase XerD